MLFIKMIERFYTSFRDRISSKDTWSGSKSTLRVDLDLAKKKWVSKSLFCQLSFFLVVRLEKENLLLVAFADELERERARMLTCEESTQWSGCTHIHLHCVWTGNEAGYSGDDMVVAWRPTDTVSRWMSQTKWIVVGLASKTTMLTFVNVVGVWQSKQGKW